MYRLLRIVGIIGPKSFLVLIVFADFANIVVWVLNVARQVVVCAHFQIKIILRVSKYKFNYLN